MIMHKMKLLIALTIGFTSKFRSYATAIACQTNGRGCSGWGAAGAGNIKGINYWLFTEIPAKGKT